MYKFTQAVDRYVLSIDNHQEMMGALAAFCKEQGIRCGAVYGIGAVCNATFRFLDPATKKYVDKTFEEQMELTAITGNISEKDGEVYLHVHVTASRRDYTCIGGHLLRTQVNGACELVVERFEAAAGRYFDEETGLNLYKFD